MTTINKGSYRIKVYQDEYANDDLLGDVFGKVIHCHPRYTLFGDMVDRDDIEDNLPKEGVILPLYLYDHGGLSLSTSSFSCQWDNGQVGFIYADKDTIIKEYSKYDDETIELVKRVLVSQVKDYDNLLQGNVYGYTIEKVSTCNCCKQGVSEDLDSCSGFIGYPDESGIIEAINESLPDEYKVSKGDF